jgi:hypothetical protein
LSADEDLIAEYNGLATRYDGYEASQYNRAPSTQCSVLNHFRSPGFSVTRAIHREV